MIPLLDLISERNVMFWPSSGREIVKYKQTGEPEFVNIPVSKIIGKYRFVFFFIPGGKSHFRSADNKFKLARCADFITGANITCI